jgi:hypothetical protein
MSVILTNFGSLVRQFGLRLEHVWQTPSMEPGTECSQSSAFSMKPVAISWKSVSGQYLAEHKAQDRLPDADGIAVLN